jgi:hypothetical protein
MQFTQQSVATLSEGQTIQLLSAYFTHLHHGATLQQLITIFNQTLQGYIGTAANAFTVITKCSCLAYDPATLHQRQPSFHPFLCQQLTQQANWCKPQDQVEPLTSAMFEALFQEISSSTDPSGTFIHPRLGIYGRSWQTKVSREYGLSIH